MSGSEDAARGAIAAFRARVRDPETRMWIGVAVLALLGGVLVGLIAYWVFPYHSLNHDEGVYLQQTRMLLDAQLFLNPPVPEAFRPWFFVESSAGMYSKYSPVTAAMYAPALAVGIPRLALVSVASALVALVIGLGAELFDRPTGLLAGVVLLTSPLFLVNTAVFLPYAPTTLLNLAFALAYLRADRTGSRRLAAIAGGAIGLAFFARPYTAVLFAIPFIFHALWTLRTRTREVLVRQGTVAAFGLIGVAITLGYNAVVTGSALEFPYQAFAPRDGIGFGTRELLGREVEYTPELAARANARVLWSFATEWVAAGLLGTLTAGIGLIVALRNRTPRRLALAGLVITVPLGELYFWGTLNILGELGEAGDGLIHYLGPYYHFDLLVPFAIFAGLALKVGGKRVRTVVEARLDPQRALAVSLALLAIGATVGGAAALGTVAEPVERNHAVTEQLDAAYEPFERQSFENGLVFLPQPYGPWLNHPFQTLRNDPGYDGPAVYALEERPFAVVNAFPDRTIYRYSFRNPWPPTAGEPVEPRLQRIRAAEGERVGMVVTAGVPRFAERVSVRIETEQGHVTTSATAPDGNLSVALAVSDARVFLTGSDFENESVPIEERDTVRTRLFVDYGTGAGFSYVVSLPVESGDGSVRALSPHLELCQVPHRCGGAATYVPDTRRPGQYLNATLEVSE